MIDRLSVVMTLPPSRIDYLKNWTLYSYQREKIPKEKLELVVVEDIAEGEPRLQEIKSELLEVFGTVKQVVMDKRKSIIPAETNCPALGLNIAFKAASHEAVYKTDPECVQLGTLKFSFRNFDPNKVIYMQARRTGQEIFRHIDKDKILNLNFNDLANIIGAQQPCVRPNSGRCYWWFGCLIPRSRFIQAGGIDERTMAGFAGDDDLWAHVIENAGASIEVTDKAEVLHLWHPSPNINGVSLHGTSYHQHNINLLLKCREEKWKEVNQNMDWGSNSCIVSNEVWTH